MLVLNPGERFSISLVIKKIDNAYPELKAQFAAAPNTKGSGVDELQKKLKEQNTKIQEMEAKIKQLELEKQKLSDENKRKDEMLTRLQTRDGQAANAPNNKINQDMGEVKRALIEKFNSKIRYTSDELKPIYQSIVDNISKESDSKLSQHFGITTAQEVDDFIENVSMHWRSGEVIKSRQKFIVTAKACKYAYKWGIYFDGSKTFLDTLTIDDWNLIFDAVADDKVSAFEPTCECMIIRNGNKVFAKEQYSKKWLDSITPQINGACDVIIYLKDKDKLSLISSLEIRRLYYYNRTFKMNLTLKHPQALRVAFLRYAHLENLEQYENLSSVCYYDSNDPDEFEALPNNKVVIKYGS